MTETQAKSEATGAPANPVDEEAAQSGTSATGRTAVGRAVVPADASPPKFTRAPGMAPPPDRSESDRTSTGSDGSSHLSAVTSAPPAGGVGVDSGQSGSAPTSPGVREQSVEPSPDSATRPHPAAAGRVQSAVGSAAAGAARVTQAVRTARNTVGSAASRGPRRARLNLKRVDPWSVMKFSFAVSLVLFIVVIVATSVLYLALDAMGVFQSVNGSLSDLVSAGGGQDSGSFEITAKGVIGTAVVLGLINVVLFTALATLGAFIYNVCADLVGGIEVTLAERD